jgi:hypothetical protein
MAWLAGITGLASWSGRCSSPRSPIASLPPSTANQNRSDTSKGDTGVSYSDLDEAAVAACQWIWSHKPEARTHEYCGVLYRDGNGDGIHVGLPQPGKKAYSCLPSDPPEPAVMLGRYHNHRFGAEPSGRDRDIAKALPSLGHYLCGPSGIVRRISAKEGTVNVR